MSREQLKRLVDSGRIEAAAELAETSGLVVDAARLWEQACQFERAARAYLQADENHEALLLASRIGHEALIERALQCLAERPREAAAAVVRLEAAQQFETAARLLLATGEPERAGEFYERANLLLDAARAYQAARRPKSAARVLERAATDSANFDAGYLLARLYRHAGKQLASVRTLQRLLKQSPRDKQALVMLTDLLSDLELESAAQEARERALAAPGSPPGDPWDPGNATPEAGETLLFGRYVVEERVATSATAKVYRAIDRASGERVAVKVFFPTLTRGAGRDAFFRFEREVRILEELRHPAVVPLRAYYPQGPAVVLRWMAGGSLGERLKHGAESPARVAAALTRVLDALAEAHRRGMLHRDLKPDNILYDEAGSAYLADFGTAHVADHAQTVTAGVMGTLAYMAPAQRRGQKASIASDIHSVGAILWHALSGAPPDPRTTLDRPDLSGPQQRVVAALLGNPAPESAERAKELLLSVDWPTSAALGDTEVEKPQAKNEFSQRLKPRQGGSYIDEVLQRAVDIASSSPDLLDRARAFVAAEHPNLARVYRFDPTREQVWFERPLVTETRPLTHAHRAKLAAALTRLHECGGYHGAVDSAHVGWRGAEPVLVFSTTRRTSTLQEDLKGLDEL